LFTGIIEHVGILRSIEVAGDVARLVIDCGPVARGVGLGDSIAVNGACLTVTAIDGDRLSFDAVRETLEKTALGALDAGDGVHLERAMRADGRFDGHIVQGHVDCTGAVRALERDGDDVRFFVDCDADFAGLLVDKGSVTIDGVSLTIVSVEPTGFHVVLIPHTLERTTLGMRTAGSPVNLEADVLGKYVKRYLDRIR
jgi:riboflavin synthase